MIKIIKEQVSKASERCLEYKSKSNTAGSHFVICHRGKQIACMNCLHDIFCKGYDCPQ